VALVHLPALSGVGLEAHARWRTTPWVAGSWRDVCIQLLLMYRRQRAWPLTSTSIYVYIYIYIYICMYFMVPIVFWYQSSLCPT
jgi:hypothetical protein